MQEIERIIKEHKETLLVEFKEYWYWSKTEEEKGNLLWDEFLKDIGALINTFDLEKNFHQTRFFIIGLSENGETRNFKFDRNNNELEFFKNDLDDIKRIIVDKISKTFSPYTFSDDNFTDSDMKNILYEKIRLDIYDNKLFVIVIESMPFLLKTKTRIGERQRKGVKEKFAFIRRELRDNQPYIDVFDIEQEHHLKQIILSAYHNYRAIEPRNTIKHVVEAYRDFYYPRAIINNEFYEQCDNIQVSYSNPNFYEMYVIEAKDVRLLFVYFSRYTSVAKVFNRLIVDLKDELTKFHKIFLLLEEERDLKKIQFEEKFKVKENELSFGDITIKIYQPVQHFINSEIYADFKKELDFFNKSFSQVFIDPFIEETENKAIQELKYWIREDKFPIKFILGDGGIGKTTVAKKFASMLGDKDIIFIESENLLNASSTTNSIPDNIYEFVKRFIKTGFNENLFSVLLDSGTFILIVDALDEVILNNSDFDLKHFVTKIYSYCIDNLGKTKVLVTMRTEFWDETLNSYDKITLKGFDRNLAEDFFREKLQDPGKVKKAIATMHRLFPDVDDYIPFHLDMIVDMIDGEEYEVTEQCELLLKSDNFDQLIALILQREKLKFRVWDTIEEQLEILMNIVVKSNSEIIGHNFEMLLNDENKISAIKSHPLLRKQGNIYVIKYDVLVLYFKKLFLCKALKGFVKAQTFNPDETFLKVISSLNVTDDFIQRIKRFNLEQLRNIFIEYLIDNFDLENVDILNLSAFIFLLALKSNSKKDKENNTLILKKWFLLGDNEVNYLVLNEKINDKFIFDFNNLICNQCYIDYKYFSECEFGNVKFKNSKIKGKIFNINKVNFRKENFDDTCQLSNIIIAALENKEYHLKNEFEKTTGLFKKVLKQFYSGYFKEVCRDKIFSKISSNEQKIIEFLLKENVLIKTRKATHDKRNVIFLKVNPDDHSWLDRILSKQVDINKRFKTLINKFLS